MGSAVRPDVEDEARARAEKGDWDGAATAALRGYGQEILEVLVAMHRDEVDASEVWSLFAEGVWRGLPRFAWESTLRTWLYAVAKRCSLRYRRDERRRDARQAPLPEGSQASILAADLKSRTASILATTNRSRIAALRDSLPPADRLLLVLRVDRELAWQDLARVMHETEGDGDGPLDDADVTREAARLRKRFQLVKERLHELAAKEGLR